MSMPIQAVERNEEFGGAILSPAWSSDIQVFSKRLLEVALSGAALLFLSPLCLALMIGIKLSSPGPLFYRCHWVGRDGVPFFGYKFRSMCANADELKTQLKPKNEMIGPVFKVTDDPRITKFGRWMRRHSLDELPQLYSVLKGDMSLVGPRPPLDVEYANFTPKQKLKLMVKPGITCLWQVNGRNSVRDFDEWVKLDLEYISNWSFALDLKILLKTVREVVVGSGK
jgi:lipopolysaccharide/colanic/teichoic acid biosynthesis glycosyltransferase